MAYFEKSNVEQLPSQIGEHFFIVTESIGEKYAGIIYSSSVMIGGVAIAFYLGADFAAVCSAFIPVMIITLKFFGG